MRQRALTGTPMVKALACGILEDGGRVLFLLKADAQGAERACLPCVLVPSGRSPFAEIRAEFARQTGIDCQVHEIILEGRHNAGSRKRRNFVPALGFRITARNMRAMPSSEFSGFKWLRMEDAKKLRLARESEWLHRSQKKGGEQEGEGDQARAE